MYLLYAYAHCLSPPTGKDIFLLTVLSLVARVVSGIAIYLVNSC